MGNPEELVPNERLRRARSLKAGPRQNWPSRSGLVSRW